MERRLSRCTLVYREIGDSSALIRCRPHGGYSLFEIRATYAKNRRPSDYYALAADEKKAKAEFEMRYDWLRVISIREITEEPEREAILTDPLRMPLD